MKIHEFAQIIPEMTLEEYWVLKEDIETNGFDENRPIILYENKILDGRHRYKACEELGIKPVFDTYKGNQPLNYVISTNVKRRHLTKSQLACIAVEALPFFKVEAAKRMKAGVNPKVKIPEGQDRQSRDITGKAFNVAGSYVDEANNLKKESLKEFEEVKQGKKTLSEVKKEKKRKVVQKRNEELKKKGVTLPDGKFACLVIDPPWPIKKIEREVRPNQVEEIDYPVMNEEELKNFPLSSFAADDAHLYLWVTQKYLPLGLKLAEKWGFRYQCLMTWVKNVGFTPFSWMYSTEHVIFATKGNLPLLQKGLRLDFAAKVRGHSRKPNEFYELVKKVSPGPRIDIFSREKRDGFEQWGNEVDKF